MDRNYIWVGLISVILFFSFLGGTSVFQVAEARNAECAREMMERHNWVVPTFNGELRTDKPVLEYYAMLGGYYIFGVNETGARFFSALAGLLTVLATFWIVKRFINLKAAWWAVLALLSSMHAVIQFRLATPDPYLILFHTLAIYLFYEGWQTGQWKWYAGMYISLGLAILAKGPVGLVLPAISAFIFLLFSKSFNIKTIAGLKPWWGIVLMLLVSMPWYIAVHYRTNGAWTHEFFFHHNLHRFSGGIGNHNGPFFITVLFILGGMIPLSLWFVRALNNVWLNKKENKLLLLALVSFAVVAIFYAFSKTKLINYTSPSYPFFAIILGAYFSKLVDKPVNKTNIKPELYALAILALAIPLGAYFFIKKTDYLYSVSWVAWLFLLVPIGIFIALRFYKKSIKKSLLLTAATFMLANFIFFAVAFQVVDEQSPVQKFKTEVKAHKHVAAYKKFDPAFAFYAKHRITVFYELDELENFLKEHEDALVISRNKDLGYMDSIPNLTCIQKSHDLFSRKSSAIYTIK